MKTKFMHNNAGAAIGSAAGLLGSGRFNVQSMRTFVDDAGTFGEAGRSYRANGADLVPVQNASLLRIDEWRDIDRAVVEETKKRLKGIADLMSAGLTYKLGSIGITVSEWDMMSDMTVAEVNMSGDVSNSAEDTLSFSPDGIPVPVVYKDFRLNLRRLEASRLHGASLDTMTVETATRLVAEKSESMLFAGEAITIGSFTLYGYTNHPSRNTADMAEKWDDSACSGADIVDDVTDMMQTLHGDGYHGPYVMYIPKDYETKLDEDYNPGTSDTRTIRERLLALSGLTRIDVADQLADDNVIMVQLTRDVVDLAIAQDVTPVQWSNNGGMTEHFRVMAVWAPRVKKTYDGHSGICHLYEIP